MKVQTTFPFTQTDHIPVYQVEFPVKIASSLKDIPLNFFQSELDTPGKAKKRLYVSGHWGESASYKSESSAFGDILPFAKPFFNPVPHNYSLMFLSQWQT